MKHTFLYVQSNNVLQASHFFAVLMKSIQTLDSLREIKASADGSSTGFQSPQIQDGCLLELKQLTLMHVPSSITEEARAKFQKLLSETFKGMAMVLILYCISVCVFFLQHFLNKFIFLIFRLIKKKQ